MKQSVRYLAEAIYDYSDIVALLCKILSSKRSMRTVVQVSCISEPLNSSLNKWKSLIRLHRDFSLFSCKNYKMESPSFWHDIKTNFVLPNALLDFQKAWGLLKGRTTTSAQEKSA